MRQAHREFGETIEHASEDQVRGSDGGVERIAEEVGEIVWSEPFAAHYPQWMEQHGQPQRSRTLEYGKEFGIRQLTPAHVGAHVDAVDARQGGGTLELGPCAALAASFQAVASRVPVATSAQYTMGAVRDRACVATPWRFMARSRRSRSQ